jgi:predicted MFS family arabinose efflux permease
VFVVFAIACGLAVANVYYSQPLLDLIAAEVQLDPATVGVVGTATQIGYGVGLLLVVPLGDLVDRRRLVLGQTALSVVALLAVTVSPDAVVLLVSMTAVGGLAVVTQVLVAYSAALAAPGDRGRVVGHVTSGIIIGILLARTVSGTLADLAGWRAVYAVSAAATLVVALPLARVLPRTAASVWRDHRRGGAGVGRASQADVGGACGDGGGDPVEARPVMTYPRLVGSVFRLFAEVRVLRTRAVLALLTFMALTLWATSMVLPLTAHGLSTTHVGLFGVSGAAGAVGAARAGRLADRGFTQRATGIGLAVMVASWPLIALLDESLWGLALGVSAFDFGLQCVHVSNQSLILRARSDAGSRLTAGYMVCYSVGSATGAVLSTVLYASTGWLGVCAAGGAVSLTALAWWAVTHRREIPAAITLAQTCQRGNG